MDISNKNITSEEYFAANPFWAKITRRLSNHELIEYFNFISSLPENVKHEMYSIEAANAILAIGRKNNLSEDQINALAIETAKIMAAQTPLNRFIPALSQTLNLPMETARAIAREINVKIFSKASLQIKKLQEKTFGNKGHKDTSNKDTNKSQITNYKNTQRQTRISHTHKPVERVVNLQKENLEKEKPQEPKSEDPGPRVEGNVVDLSH